jgi:peptidoglycan hydrolase CwlO-like protein
VEKQVRDTMLMEDEIIEELEDRERELEEVEEQLDKVLDEKHQLDKVLEEKDKALEAQKRVIEDLMRQLNQKN